MTRQATSASAQKLIDKEKKAEDTGHKFYALDGEPIPVPLPDGRTAIVDGNPRTLPQAFWRAALAAGCATTRPISREDAARTLPTPALDQFQRSSLIEKAISDALAAAEGEPGFEDAVLPNGTLSMDWLSKRVGFQVERSERDAAHRRVSAELDRQDETGKQGADKTDAAQLDAANPANT